MTDEITTHQVKRPAPNPTGKGGFGDHPENRSPGGWKKENTFSYWLNFFKHLSVEEFKKYEETHPDDQRTVAESIAYARVINARADLSEFKEVADRTEGKVKQVVEQETTLNINTHEEVAKKLQAVLEEGTIPVITDAKLSETIAVDPTKPLEYN